MDPRPIQDQMEVARQQKREAKQRNRELSPGIVKLEFCSVLIRRSTVQNW